MKKLLISIFSVLIFGIGSTTVSAKTLENTCTYTGNIERSGNDKQIEMEITCSFYDNNSHKCYLNANGINNNAEEFVNWGSVAGGGFNAKQYYSDNKTCFPYVVFLDTGAAFGAFEIYAADSYSTALTIESDRDAISGYKASVLEGDSVSSDATSKLQGYTEMLNNIGEAFELATYCGLKDGVYYVDPNKTGYKSCINKMQEVYNKINEWDQYVKDQIAAGNLSENHKSVKEYYAARDSARSRFSSDYDDSQYDDTDDSTGNVVAKDPDYSFSQNCVSCGNGTLKDIPAQLPQFVRNIILIMQLLVPVILIGLGMYDFIRAVISSDDKLMKESQNRFIKRIMGAVLIFFTVVIVKFVFSLIPGESVLGCIPCFVSDKESCGTEYTCPSTQTNTSTDSEGEEEHGGGGHSR